MKKLTILTSVLALAACGGGSGGGNNAFAPTSVARTGTVTQNAIESNAVITGMVSEIGESTTDNSTINIGRSATNNKFSYNGKEYVSHKLDEVDFVFADHAFGAKMKFNIDESTGEIIGIDFIENHNVYYDAQLISEFLRDDNENIIGIVIDYGNNETKTYTQNKYEIDFEYDGDNNIIGVNLKNTELVPYDRVEYNPQNKDESKKFYGRADDQNNHNEEQGTETFFVYNSMGKDVGLKYSDFGVQEDNVLGNIPFMGGYDIKKIDVTAIENITSNNTFSGKAAGYVVSSQTGGQGSGRRINLDGDATLTFDPTNNNTTIMTASFNNWYDITYTENSDGKNIALTNYKYKENDVINDSFKMISNTPNFSDDEFESDVRYFGDNNTPTEAVGLIQIRDCGGTECGSNNNFDTPETRMNIGFGMTKDNQ